MFRSWPLTIAKMTIIGYLMFCALWASPARAMIFPDLLSLVRVEDDRAAANETAGPEKNPEKAAAENTKTEEIYVVQEGDTLWKLSSKYCVDWKTIAYANSLDLNGVIRPGQRLTIPVEGVIFHVVKPGETLSVISLKYKKDVSSLAAANDIADINRLRVGTRLVIPEEQAVQATASPREKLSSRYGGYWKLPIKGVFTSGYGPRGNEFHHGLDIAAEEGDKIFPVRGGIVEFSGWLNYIYGNAVIVDHGNGIKSLYAHNSENLVEEGDKVGTSTALARIGSSGRTTGPHLHLEIRVDGQTVDPKQFLK